MNAAVWWPAFASRIRCSMGSRTRACTPLMNARPVARVERSSRVTVSIAWRCSGETGAFMGMSRWPCLVWMGRSGGKSQLPTRSERAQLMHQALGQFDARPLRPLLLFGSALPRQAPACPAASAVVVDPLAHVVVPQGLWRERLRPEHPDECALPAHGA